MAGPAQVVCSRPGARLLPAATFTRSDGKVEAAAAVGVNGSRCQIFQTSGAAKTANQTTKILGRADQRYVFKKKFCSNLIIQLFLKSDRFTICAV